MGKIEALLEFGVQDGSETEALREACRLVRQAGELEEAGDVYGAIKKHQRKNKQTRMQRFSTTRAKALKIQDRQKQTTTSIYVSSFIASIAV